MKNDYINIMVRLMHDGNDNWNCCRWELKMLFKYDTHLTIWEKIAQLKMEEKK